jgi:hypothetical protein
MDHNGPIGAAHSFGQSMCITWPTKKLWLKLVDHPKMGLQRCSKLQALSFFEKIKTCNFVDPNEKWQLRVPQFRIAKLFERQFEVNSLGIRGKLSPIFAWLLELGSSVSSRDSHC